MKLKLLSIFLAVFFAVFYSVEASAHYNSYDSVDGNEEIRVENHSKYYGETAWAISKWGALDDAWGANRGVNIAFNSSYETVETWDICEPRASYTGWYQTSYSPDRISYNVCITDSYPAWAKRSLAVHEMGHALGFSHPPGGKKNKRYYTKNSIMWSTSYATNRDVPLAHDIYDYYYRWIA